MAIVGMNGAQMYARLMARYSGGHLSPVFRGAGMMPVRPDDIPQPGYWDISEYNETCTDGQNDGKIGALEKIGNFAYGLVQPFCSLASNAWNHPFKTLGALALFGTVGFLCPPLAAGLAAWGLVNGAGQAIGGIIDASKSGGTDAQKKAAIQNIGAGFTTGVLSAFGLKASIGAMTKAAEAGKGVSAINQLKNGGKLLSRKLLSREGLTALWHDAKASTVHNCRLAKDAVMHPVQTFNHIRAAWNARKEAAKASKPDPKKTAEQPKPKQPPKHQNSNPAPKPAEANASNAVAKAEKELKEAQEALNKLLKSGKSGKNQTQRFQQAQQRVSNAQKNLNKARKLQAKTPAHAASPLEQLQTQRANIAKMLEKAFKSEKPELQAQLEQLDAQIAKIKTQPAAVSAAPAPTPAPTPAPAPAPAPTPAQQVNPCDNTAVAAKIQQNFSGTSFNQNAAPAKAAAYVQRMTNTSIGFLTKVKDAVIKFGKSQAIAKYGYETVNQALLVLGTEMVWENQ